MTPGDCWLALQHESVLGYMQSKCQMKKLGCGFSLSSDVNYRCIMLHNLVTTLLRKVIYASLGMQSLACKNNKPLWGRLAKLCLPNMFHTRKQKNSAYSRTS